MPETRNESLMPEKPVSDMVEDTGFDQNIDQSLLNDPPSPEQPARVDSDDIEARLETLTDEDYLDAMRFDLDQVAQYQNSQKERESMFSMVTDPEDFVRPDEDFDMVSITNNRAVLTGERERPAFQVVLVRSGYLAGMIGFGHNDFMSIYASNMDAYRRRDLLYRRVFSKIQHSTVKDMSYSDWLKLTFFNDYEILVYGIYNQTFGSLDPQDYSMQCGKCRKEVKIKMTPDQFLIDKKGKIAKEVRRFLLQDQVTVKQLLASDNHKPRKIKLDKSQIWAQLSRPTLHDSLRAMKHGVNLAKKVGTAQSEALSNYAGMLTYIDKMLVPFIKGTKDSGRPTYLVREDADSVMEIIESLPNEDYRKLQRETERFDNELRIQFQRKEFVCPLEGCGHVNPAVDLDMEELLVFHLQRVVVPGDEED